MPRKGVLRTEEQRQKERERDREYKRKKRNENKEETRRKAAEWRAKNKDKIKEYNSRQWERTKADPEKLEKDRRRHRIENMSPEKAKQEGQRKRALIERRRREAWQEGTTLYQLGITPEKRERNAQLVAKWREENLEKARENGRKSTQRYRNRRGVRAGVDDYAYKAVRMALVSPDMRSKYFPGYTGGELKRHILGQLPNGWTIADYGDKWEIDHILPISAFDYQSYEDEEYRRCWSLGNLRPLCKIENRKKNGVRARTNGTIPNRNGD